MSARAMPAPGSLAALVVLALGALPSGPNARGTAGARQDEASQETRFFAIPLARTARFLAEEVEDHIAAERWSSALAGLQSLIEEHSSEVLPGSFRPSARLPSDYPAHPGAAFWAERRLRSLPEEALALYRDRYEPAARLALELALERGDRRLVAEVARRWPVTETAARAWWVLGDLELESGYPDSALAAWELALASRARGDGPPPGAQARLTDARKQLASRGLSRDDGSFPPMPEAGAVPQGDADTWSRPIDLDPITASRSGYKYNVFPVVADDRVLVTNTHRVFAIDAYSGETLWQYGPPPGWERLSRRVERELREGIHYERLLVAPAVGGNVVVASLHIPYSRDTNHDWQGIEIIRSIPERRLFAFDLETGAELWNHMPPLRFDEQRRLNTWEESLGSYEETMLVAAPPTIAGTRVLVPCYRLQGRIDYHVACYDLFTGERLWSTGLVSGQRERNMFGRANKEFVASPVAVSGNRVVAQTELGTVACLDLVTGGILWESLYQQIPLPKNHSYQTPTRLQVWRETAPVIADDVVIATPTDSYDLLAFDLEDGRVLWSQNEYRLRTSYGPKPEPLDLLVGADEDTVYLAGQQLLVLQKPGGLGSRSSFVSRRPDLLDDSREHSRPRAILGPEEIVVPLRAERRVFERSSMEPAPRKSAPWPSAQYGNLVLGKGVLFSLSPDWLTAYFDWSTLIARQRKLLAERPDDPAVAVATAEILARRGESLFARDGDTGRALEQFLEARRVLEPRLGREVGGVRHRLSQALHRVLRGEARARIALPDREGALAALEEALPLATTAEERRDTLFERDSLLTDRPLSERLALWRELESLAGSLPLPTEDLDDDPGWLIGEALVHPEALAAWKQADLKVELWVLLTRADALARARETGAALVDLHAALAHYGDVPLSPTLTVGDLVTERISRRLEFDGRREYAPFEEAARELFDAARAEGTLEGLAEVARLYPQSRAAGEARNARLETAYARDDAGTIAAILYGSRGERSSEEELDALVRLALVLDREGNAEFLTGLLASLAAESPTRRLDLLGGGERTVLELSRERRASQVAAEPPSTFGPGVGLARSYAGAYRFLGRLYQPRPPAESPRPPLHVYIGTEDILAFGVDDPGRPRWTHPLPFALSDRSSALSTCAIGPDRILAASAVGEQGAVIALDSAGDLVWDHLTEFGRVENVTLESGVALVQLSGPRRVAAFDAHAGTPLWTLDLDDSLEWRRPVVGEGKAVWLSFRHGTPSLGLVVDVFRGRVLTRLEVGRTEKDTNESAWIQDGWLLVPRFSASRRPSGPSGVVGFDLEQGTQATMVEFDQDEELASIVQAEGRDYLIAVATGPQGHGRAGGVYAFDVSLKSLQRVVDLRPGDRAMGVPARTRVVLEEPYLFLYGASSEARPVQVQAIHLPYERRWVYTLPVRGAELHDDGLSLPALSEECVVFAYRTKRGSRRDEARLEFVDKNGGYRLDSRVLPPEFADDTRIELRGHGPALFVVGQNRDESRIEIMEELR